MAPFSSASELSALSTNDRLALIVSVDEYLDKRIPPLTDHSSPEKVIAIHEALEKLAAMDERKARSRHTGPDRAGSERPAVTSKKSSRS